MLFFKTPPNGMLMLVARYRTVLHPLSSQATSLITTATIILGIDLFAIIITLP